MEAGYSPSDIILLLEANDVQSNPGIRQYGVVDLYNENNYGMLYEEECLEIDGCFTSGLFQLMTYFLCCGSNCCINDEFRRL